jgi:hypothetical protein
VRFGERRQQTQRHKEVGDAAGVVDSDVVLNDIAIRGAKSSNGSSDQTRVVCDGRTRVGNLHGAAIGDSLKKAQEGNLMGS